jgi:tetratricopeptide (TPR) repeat protein
VPAYAGRGSAYRLKGDLVRALADYEKALLLEPGNAQVRCSQGVLYRIKGDLERAQAELDEAIRLEPKNWSALYHRGKVFLAQGRFAEALTDLTAALSLNARLLVAYLSRAIIHDRLAKYQEALADGTRAITLDARSPAARLVRGVVHGHMGSSTAAIADLTAAIRLDRRLALAYHERSRAYTLRGEYERALADCHQLLALESGNAQAYAHRSIVYQYMGDIEKALVDYSRALQLDPGCLMTAWDQGLADNARLQTTQRLADYIDGVRHKSSKTNAPPPASFRIVLLPYPKGLIGVTRASGGEAVAWTESPPVQTRIANGATTGVAQATPTQSTPQRGTLSGSSGPSNPEIVLRSSERPAYRSARRLAGLENDEEETGFLGRWKIPVVLGAAGAVALVLVCLGLWFRRSDHVRVYPAHGRVVLEGKPIPHASIRLDPVWTKAPLFPKPHAIVQEDGSFALGTYGKEDGAPAGEYRVSVQWLVKSEKTDYEGGALPQNHLPPRYANFETSGLKVQIQEGETAIPVIQLKR